MVCRKEQMIYKRVEGKEGQGMKGLDNNELCVTILEKMKQGIDHRTHELYNQAYAQGYKDGVTDTTQKIADNILSEVEE